MTAPKKGFAKVVWHLLDDEGPLTPIGIQTQLPRVSEKYARRGMDKIILTLRTLERNGQAVRIGEHETGQWRVATADEYKPREPDARPRSSRYGVSPTGESRREFISAGVTVNQKIEVMEAAEREGISQGEFIRRAVFGLKTKEPDRHARTIIFIAGILLGAIFTATAISL